MSEPSTIRRTILFSGRVQGVGFRMTTREIALGRPVCGYVRNLPDGRVEAVMEGAADAIDACLTELRRVFGANIRDMQVTTAPALGVFSSFEIQA